MNALPQWFAYFLIGNCLVVLGYALLNLLWPGEKNRSWEIRAAVMLLCPGVGACFFLVSWLMYRLVFRTPVDLSDVVFSKERVESVTKSNEALAIMVDGNAVVGGKPLMPLVKLVEYGNMDIRGLHFINAAIDGVRRNLNDLYHLYEMGRIS